MVKLKRREYLATTSLTIAAVSGCLDQVPFFSSCKLRHEVSKKEPDSGYGDVKLAYGELSERGQTVFRKALESDAYVIDYNGNNAPSDFSYSDETSTYLITYQGEEYVLFTYTSSGCTIK